MRMMIDGTVNGKSAAILGAILDDVSIPCTFNDIPVVKYV